MATNGGHRRHDDNTMVVAAPRAVPAAKPHRNATMLSPTSAEGLGPDHVAQWLDLDRVRRCAAGFLSTDPPAPANPR
jgi:hypothetical protein